MILVRFCLALVLFINFRLAAALPEVWQLRDSAATNHLNGIACGNGLFVAVGSEATILTSSNGRDWTRRSGGVGSQQLFSATYGKGSFVAGGDQTHLLQSSTDGVNWIIRRETTGMEQIFGITFGNGLFVAVGSGPATNSSYILTSSDTVIWTSRIIPIAVLRAVTRGPNIFVAVGDSGAILTSPDGAAWTPRSSGTSSNLRGVTFHQSRFIAAGDNGTVLASSDGISWGPAAPISFSVRALASGGDALVAVGNFSNAGRLHASTDGLTWPGRNEQFPAPLNAIAYGPGSFVAVGNAGLIIQSEKFLTAITNEWTKTASGYWEEPFWSAGELPSIDYPAIAFRNSGFKALAIGANTTANYSNSLFTKTLIVDAPPGSTNQLLLNYAGLNVPLNVRGSFVIGPRASLVSYHSALRATNLLADGSITFDAGTSATFDNLKLGVNNYAELFLDDANLKCGDLVCSHGRLTQRAGLAEASVVALPNFYPDTSGISGEYILTGGTLLSQGVNIGSLGFGTFHLAGGVHSNSFAMDIYGVVTNGTNLVRGRYMLTDGLLYSQSSIWMVGGAFTQSGGTGIVSGIRLDRAGSYTLTAGTLISTNTTLLSWQVVPGTPARFVQTGGRHIVDEYLLVEGSSVSELQAVYQLQAGDLTARSIDIGLGGELRLEGGVITNSGSLGFRGGTLRPTISYTQQFGVLYLGLPSLLDFGNGSTVFRLLDSHDLGWNPAGALTILNWSGSINGRGRDQLFIGTNSGGLSSYQLSRLSFSNPAGLPPGTYPARILATGEIVPGPAIAFARTSHSLVFSWPGNYELLTATNATGPFIPISGASSPFTNQFTDPQRFFLLRSPQP